MHPARMCVCVYPKGEPVSSKLHRHSTPKGCMYQYESSPPASDPEHHLANHIQGSSVVSRRNALNKQEKCSRWAPKKVLEKHLPNWPISTDFLIRT